MLRIGYARARGLFADQVGIDADIDQVYDAVLGWGDRTKMPLGIGALERVRARLAEAGARGCPRNAARGTRARPDAASAWVESFNMVVYVTAAVYRALHRELKRVGATESGPTGSAAA